MLFSNLQSFCIWDSEQIQACTYKNFVYVTDIFTALLHQEYFGLNIALKSSTKSGLLLAREGKSGANDEKHAAGALKWMQSHHTWAKWALEVQWALSPLPRQGQQNTRWDTSLYYYFTIYYLYYNFWFGRKRFVAEGPRWD